MGTTKRDEQATQTKNKIMKTALSLIQRYGYQGMSLRRLCQELGISTGAFYHHFTSKEEIINAGFARYDEALEELLEQYVFGDPLTDLRFILLHQTKFVMETSGNLTKELYIAELSADEKYSVKPYRKYYQTVLQLVTQAKTQGRIKSSMTDVEITSFLLRINRGNILDWCLNDYAYNLIKQAEQDVDFVLQNLVCRE